MIEIAPERVRRICKLAAGKTTDPFTRSWFERDETGFWEKEIRRILAEKYAKITALGIPEAHVDEDLSEFLLLAALTARMNEMKKRAGK